MCHKEKMNQSGNSCTPYKQKRFESSKILFSTSP
uniref:Uncharacterized protein n=1 Tax=Arundo donax TaxID=35708 RepID=A0A0A9BYH0_ARUDO